MEFLIVTGMSGSGKSGAAKVLEDIGFYCIDNMPPQLIQKFAEICSGGNIERAAIVADIRGGDMFFELPACVTELRNNGLNVKILFLDAEDDVLFKRYRETRRKHPLDEQSGGDLALAISMERKLVESVKEAADYYVNTSQLSTSQLKERISGIFLDDISGLMLVDVLSFGFKYGVPKEADLLFDVRCLPNPFYIPELRHHTGREDCIQDYVLQFEQSRELLSRLTDLIDFLIPLYTKEGKSRLVIAFGCTGGKHRSVTFAEKLTEHLMSKNVKVRVSHRDIIKI